MGSSGRSHHLLGSPMLTETPPHFADPPAADQLAGQRIMGVLLAGSQLAAGLEHAIELADRLDHRRAFVDRQRQRLLAIHVLARLARLDRRDGVPMVGRGDEHGVDVLAGEHVAEVVVLVAAFGARGGAVVLVDPLLGVAAAVGVDVADGQNANVVEPEKRGDVKAVGLHPQADHADGDLVAGARLVAAEHRAGNDRGNRDRRRGSACAGSRGG